MKSFASKKSLVFVCAVLTLGAVAALPAFSQAPQAPAQAGPPPEVGQLSFFAGTWSCTGKAEATPMGPAHPTQATVHIGNDIGGYWYVGHYAEKKTAANPHPMVFHFVQGYDASAKAFSMDCFDAYGGHCHQTSAGWKDGKLIYSGEATGSGPAMQVRDTFTQTGEAGLEHSGELQVEGKWVFLDHETCQRIKK